MGKDPAFLFYSSDFLTGTMFFSNEQVGLFIRMLCAQHQHGGRINTNELRTQCERIANGDAVYSKFKHDKRGSYNERLEKEMIKRSKKGESARESANYRWQNKKPKQSERNAIAMRSENENEIENESINENNIQKVIFENFGDFANELVPVWEEWITFKKQQFNFKFKTTKSEITAILNLKKLSNASTDSAIDIIRQSIANGWKGLFEIKTKLDAGAERDRIREEYVNRWR